MAGTHFSYQLATLMQSGIWLAPAKLNLFLHIVGRRNDGYHELQTIFQLLNYCDELLFTPRTDNQIHCQVNFLSSLTTSSQTIINNDNNLVIKAAKLLQQFCNCPLGVDITLNKRIPIGGGLGGGSSNAATTLVALNHLWQLNLPKTQLLSLGLQLGADVPVFIHGHSAWAEGIGEKLESIDLAENWFIVLIPPVTVSTHEIFSDPQLTRTTPAIKIQTILSGQQTRNDCEIVVRQHYPLIASALDWLNQFATARLTGTGSCVFAAVGNKAQAEAIKKQIPAELSGFIAQGINKSPLWQLIDIWGVAKR